MKASAIEYTQDRIEVGNNHFTNIQNYGEFNDYPQSVIDIVAASHTGSSCLRKYADFVCGKGFADKSLFQITVNKSGTTLDQLLRALSFDYCRFGGFAVHVNRNLLGQITSMSHIAFENVRLCVEDVEEFKNKVAIHPDWRGSDKRYRNVNIEYIDTFTPNVDEFRERILNTEGGILQYKGEVYYYSNRGSGNYPLPIFDCVLTDMATQEAISNITYLNSRKNFLPGCIFAEVKPEFDPTNKHDQEEFKATNEQIGKMQGDANATSLLHVVVGSKDNLPIVIPIKSNNYDKDFTVSRDSVETSIGQAFMQPKEIRCEDSTTGFSQDTMEQAYKVYNSIVENDRLEMERQFAYLMKYWYMQVDINLQIEPLSYGTENLLSSLGDKIKDVIEMAKDSTIPTEQRKAFLIELYGISEDIANKLLLIQSQNSNANDNR